MISILVSPSEADRKLSILLQTSGARVWIWPRPQIAAPNDASSLGEAINNLFGYDWLILKNADAAGYFMRSFLQGHQPEELEELRVLTIGSETFDKASELCVHVDITLERFSHSSVFSQIDAYVGDRQSLARLNFLVPCASITCEHFQQELADAGARVDSVTAYQTSADDRRVAQIKALLIGGGIDCIAFTQPSAVGEFARLFDTDDLAHLLAGVTILCDGDATTAAAKEFGLGDTLRRLEPSEWSVEALGGLIKAPGN